MKAAIFDLDGTLLDSMGMWRQLLPEFLRNADIDNVDDEIAKVEKMSFQEAAAYVDANLPVGKTEEELLELWRGHLEEQYRAKLLLKPYVREYLDHLRERGIKMAVATLTQKPNVLAALRRLGIEDYFSIVLTTDEVGCFKDRPVIYQECAKHMGVDVAEAVVFEDSPYAIVTAGSAGFPVFAVHDPIHEYSEELIATYCERLVHSFKELLEEEKTEANQ